MSEIDDLTAKVRRLRNQLKAAEGSLRAALLADHDIKAGDVIVDRSDKEFLVKNVSVPWLMLISITPTPTPTVRYTLVARKNNGEWSKAKRLFYSNDCPWRKLEQQEER